jgi:hypothetical protein
VRPAGFDLVSYINKAMPGVLVHVFVSPQLHSCNTHTRAHTATLPHTLPLPHVTHTTFQQARAWLTPTTSPPSARQTWPSLCRQSSPSSTTGVCVFACVCWGQSSVARWV